MSDFSQENLPPKITPMSNTVGIGELEQNEKMLSQVNEHLKFLRGSVSRLEKNFISESKGDSILFEQTNEAFDALTDKVRPRREALLKAGAAGTAAVYIGDKLQGMEKAMEKASGPKFLDKVKNLLGGAGAGLASKLRLPKIPGGARGLGGMAFAGLTLTDLLGPGGGLEQMKGGEVGKGLLTTLLGREAETDADVGTGMLKQGAKWGAFGSMVGGPVGAAIGFGVGSLTAGIKGAFEREFDKRTEEFGQNIRDVWEDPDAGIGTKLWTTTKEAGKTILGVLAGGVREVGEGWKDRAGDIKDIWKDEERGVVGKIGGTIFQGFRGVLETGSRFTIGALKSAEKFIVGTLSEKNKKRWKDFKGRVKEQAQGIMGSITNTLEKGKEYTRDFFEVMRKKGLRGLGETQLAQDIRAKWLETGEQIREKWDDIKARAREAWGGFKDRVSEGWNVARENWQGMVNEIKEKGLGTFLKEKFEVFKEKFGDFADKIRKVSSSIVDFFGNLGGKVGDFFTNVFGGDQALLGRWSEQLSEGKITKGELSEKITGERSLQKSFARDVLGLEGGDWRQVRGEDNRLKGEYKDQFLNYLSSEYGFTDRIDDAIIKPNGQIIKMNPKDTLFATKAFDDGTMNQVLNSSQSSTQIENQMLNVLQNMNQKLGNNGAGGVVQNNFIDRFNPQNVLQAGMVEVF